MKLSATLWWTLSTTLVYRWQCTAWSWEVPKSSLNKIYGTWSPGVPWVFPFGKLTCEGLFSCALVSNTQIALSSSPILQVSRGLIHTTVGQNPSYKLKVSELVDLTTSGLVSRYTGYKPNNLWSSLQCLGTHECVGQPLEDTVDWTTKGAVTPVKNDGQCGSCLAFASTDSPRMCLVHCQWQLIAVERAAARTATRSSACLSDRRAWVWSYLYNQLDGEFKK